MQPTITGLFAEAAKKLRADFEYIRATNPHSGDKGEEVENILKKFLNDHLPKRFRVDSGIVIDADDAISRQTDAIVYDALTSPIYRAAEKTQIIPIQCVAAVIEVKSRLDGPELEDAYDKIASVKSLKKPPHSTMDQPTTKSGLDSIGTMGIVFAFDSALTLETLGEKMKELNAKKASFLWPDLVVVLDRGTAEYMVQWPGQFGKFAATFAPQPPPGHDKVSPPPWYVHLGIINEGEYSLNRFFLLLLAHLTFFPFRYGPLPFGALAKEGSKTMTLGGYQFDRSRQLRAVSPDSYGEGPKPLRMNIRDKAGKLVAVLQHFPWQDGFVVRKYGRLPLEGLLPLFVKDARALSINDPNQPDMQITSLLDVDEKVFRGWPNILKKRSNMRGEVLGPDDPKYDSAD